jgi:hypothetical protein
LQNNQIDGGLDQVDIVCLIGVFGKTVPDDGGSIFVRNLIKALETLGNVKIEKIPVQRDRSNSLPVWAAKVDLTLKSYLDGRRSQGAFVFLTHEALFDYSASETSGSESDILLVQNFMPRFNFPGRHLLNTYYKIGSIGYFGRHFDSARLVVFVSRGDLDSAARRYGAGVLDKSITMAPPARPLDVIGRDTNILHMGGTDGWRAKRLSKLTQAEAAYIAAEGFDVQDINSPATSGNALVCDRFSVGFKLKLAEMIWCHDVIASLSDVEAEVKQIAPDYPNYATVGSVEDAVRFFRDSGNNICEADFESATLEFKSYTWVSAATNMINAIRRASA